MADENAVQPNVTRLYAFSELPEILAAALIVFSLIPINENRFAGVWIAVVLVLLSIALKLVAGARERKRVSHDVQAMHVVTEHRLKTLKTVGAGEDVIEVLKLRLDQPMPAQDLVRWLEEELGRGRMQEKIGIVRRYTRTTEKGVGQH